MYHNECKDMRKIKAYIHSHEEARLIMHAVRLGLLKPAKDRPSIEERDSIRSGSIFCFVETADGMKRWTDGKIWSPSKIMGHFLLYKEVPRHLSKSALKKERNDGRRRRCFDRRDVYNDDTFTLYKKTISIEHDNKTYHVISYYQPWFDKRGIMSIKFFKDLHEALNVNPQLLKDSFVEEMQQGNISINELYGVPVPTNENLVADIDRVELERFAISVLRGRLKDEMRNLK